MSQKVYKKSESNQNQSWMPLGEVLGPSWGCLSSILASKTDLGGILERSWKHLEGVLAPFWLPKQTPKREILENYDFSYNNVCCHRAPVLGQKPLPVETVKAQIVPSHYTIILGLCTKLSTRYKPGSLDPTAKAPDQSVTVKDLRDFQGHSHAENCHVITLKGIAD